MATLRTPDEIDPLPPDNTRDRIQKLQDLVCGGPWGNRDDLCLLYWKPNVNGGEWVAWSNSTPNVDPLPAAGVSVP